MKTKTAQTRTAKPKPRRVSEGEEMFALQVLAACLPEPEREFRFHATRRWRADFAFPERMLLVEIDGSVWARGRHNTGAGYTKDCEKLNAAALLGYRVLRFTTGMVKDGSAIETLRQVLADEKQAT